MATIDPRELRNAFGSFTTGVTIVSYAHGDKAYGLTVNSFSSVSLEPPLVLWSLQKNSDCFDDIMQAEHYAINVLTAAQQDISNHLARKEMHDLDRLEQDNAWEQGRHSPILRNTLACFECASEHRYEGGDHIILVGRVLHYTHNQGDPLVFYGGAYAQINAGNT